MDILIGQISEKPWVLAVIIWLLAVTFVGLVDIRKSGWLRTWVGVILMWGIVAGFPRLVSELPDIFLLPYLRATIMVVFLPWILAILWKKVGGRFLKRFLGVWATLPWVLMVGGVAVAATGIFLQVEDWTAMRELGIVMAVAAVLGILTFLAMCGLDILVEKFESWWERW